jgi:hypothetical protein
MRCGAVDVDAVGLGQLLDSGARADLDLRVTGEVALGALGDVGFDLVGDDLARVPDETGVDRGLIAGAGADLDDRLALPHAERVDRLRMQRRLAVVDAALGVDADENILIEAGGVIRRGQAKETAGADPPWRRTGEILARDGGEGGFDPGVADAGAAHDLGGIGLPAFRQSIRHAAPLFLSRTTIRRL